MMGRNKGLHMVTFILMVVGGLNWGVYGLTGWEIGSLFGGMEELIPRIIYVLVGLSALFEVVTHGGRCKACDKSGQMGPSASAM